MRRAAAGALASALVACTQPQALGEENRIVVAATAPAWEALEAPLRSALEESRFTVRDERVFDVGRVDPAGREWASLRRLKQVLVIGRRGDRWVDEALDEVEGEIPAPPAIAQARNVWARPQLVTVLLLEPEAPPAAASSLADPLGRLYRDQLARHARETMFVTGRNERLADSLRRTAGFALTLPAVYRHAEVEPGLWIFRNDQPDPSRLIRQVVVDTRAGGPGPEDAAGLLAWRRRIAAATVHPPQRTEGEEVRTRALEVAGRGAVEVRGVWSNPPGGWPAAGPFITRAVKCPGGSIRLDAWLYAPGTSKFPYLVQLETILDSFRCGS